MQFQFDTLTPQGANVRDYYKDYGDGTSNVLFQTTIDVSAKARSFATLLNTAAVLIADSQSGTILQIMQFKYQSHAYRYFGETYVG